MGLLEVLRRRGFLSQCTDEAGLAEYLASPFPAGYIGFDCTARSLHVGSLVQLMVLRHMQASGVRPIVLLGGATTKVGDPSGKDETRRMLDAASIEANKEGIKSVVLRLLRTDGIAPMFVDNEEWLGSLGYIDFLREIGPHFSVNRMLTFDSVRTRLSREQTLSFLEFNYMILQAYDFLELYRRHGCRLQIGGSDHWGNIVSGMELQRRICAGQGGAEELFGLTTPLLTTADGKKMGKTERGAVWLSPELCSPYDYWQFWRNTDDRDVGRFLRLFTELPEEEIAAAEKAEGAELNDAKTLLSDEATRICHGREAAEGAKRAALAAFGGGAAEEGAPEWRTKRSARAFPSIRRW
jgi:tyrosyl-tRNA synthetase